MTFYPLDPADLPLSRMTRVWSTDWNLMVSVDNRGVVVVPDAPVIITVDYPYKREICSREERTVFYKAVHEDTTDGVADIDPAFEHHETYPDLANATPLAMDLALWPWYVRQDLGTGEWCLMAEDVDPAGTVPLARFSTHGAAQAIWDAVGTEQDRRETERLRRRVEELEHERDSATAVKYGSGPSASTA